MEFSPYYKPMYLETIKNISKVAFTQGTMFVYCCYSLLLGKYVFNYTFTQSPFPIALEVSYLRR